MAAGTISHRTWTIYVVTCVPTGKCYVGVTRMKLRDRWTAHLRDAKKQRYISAFHGAIRLYGPSAFTIGVICNPPDREAAMAAERRFIDEMGTKCPSGYNVADGGYGGDTRTGTKSSQETRARISAALTGRKIDPAIVEKVAAKLRGRKLSERHAAIIRVTGRKNKGRRHPPEEVRAFAIAQREKSGRRADAGCCRSGSKFRCRITYKGKHVELGTFTTIEEARAARAVAANAILNELRTGARAVFEKNDRTTKSENLSRAWSLRRLRLMGNVGREEGSVCGSVGK